MADESGGLIILAVIGTVVALVFGIIGLFMNLNWLSFPIAVAIVSIVLGLMSGDLVTAGIAGAVTGFLTALLKGFVISIFWGGIASAILNNAIGGQYLLLIFVGAIFAAGSSLLINGN